MNALRSSLLVGVFCSAVALCAETVSAPFLQCKAGNYLKASLHLQGSKYLLDVDYKDEMFPIYFKREPALVEYSDCGMRIRYPVSFFPTLDLLIKEPEPGENKCLTPYSEVKQVHGIFSHWEEEGFHSFYIECEKLPSY